MVWIKPRILQTRSGNIPQRDMQTVKARPKKTESIYSTPRFKAWRAAVVKNANGRCEHRDINGNRCHRSSPADRMFADHIVELKDGGAPFDLANGQALCGAHHTLKTAAERAKRLRR